MIRRPRLSRIRRTNRCTILPETPRTNRNSRSAIPCRPLDKFLDRKIRKSMRAKCAHDPEKSRTPRSSGLLGQDLGQDHATKPILAVKSRFYPTVYLGRTLGSRSRLPGGGMTGVLLPPGGGVTMSESTICGGQMTPSDLDNFSLRFSPPWPRVSPIERSVGSISVEQFCWPGGMTSCADGRRSCAPARATIRIQTGTAAKIPVNEIGFMPRSSMHP